MLRLLFLLLLLVSCVYPLLITGNTGVAPLELFANVSRMLQVYSKYNIAFSPPRRFPIYPIYPSSIPAPTQKGPGIVIFMHAAVGVFLKKRGPPGTYWGYGLEILLEMLEEIDKSGLGSNTAAVFITLLGKQSDRERAVDALKKVAAKSSRRLPLHVLLQGESLHVAEFPTIYALGQLAASKMARDDPNLLLLYLHTKGMHGRGQAAADWRRYMTYFLVENHDFCVKLLTKGGSPSSSLTTKSMPIKRETCGVLANEHEYEGNFWWTRAAYIRRWEGAVTSSLAAIPWNMRNRMRAEDFLFCGPRGLYAWDHELSKQEIDEEYQFLQAHSQQHYCIHHTHQNMYDCPSNRSSYEHLTSKGVFDPEKERLDSSCGRERASWVSRDQPDLAMCYSHFGAIGEND